LTSNRYFVNGTKVIDKKQTAHNYKDCTFTKDKWDTPWIETNDKKRNQNSPKIIMPHKQPKKNGHQLSKPVPTKNSFEGLKEVLDNENNNKSGEDLHLSLLIKSIIFHSYHCY